MKIIKPSVALVDTINPAEIYNKLELCGRVAHQSESKGDPENFIRKIITLGHESVLEHVSLTFHIICDRAIQNELVRHRHASFTVESTRYVKYDELTFVGVKGLVWPTYLKQVEKDYLAAAKKDFTPEQARAILPLCLKSELYMTANLREWRHILKLRTSKAAHPQMRFIAEQILYIFRRNLPVLVEDIKEMTARVESNN